ncbi:MAG: hypothetical protein EBU90_29110 [Proteobacteria bacterium]|nr:hypothetical protein [Pseudomonadota bacterium]
MKSVLKLTDEELEDCVDGSTNITMLRQIFTRADVVDSEGWINPEFFADWFSVGLAGYITEDVDSPEWAEANDTNWNWGYDIADKINSYISDNFRNE